MGWEESAEVESAWWCEGSEGSRRFEGVWESGSRERGSRKAEPGGSGKFREVSGQRFRAVPGSFGKFRERRLGKFPEEISGCSGETLGAPREIEIK